MGDRTIWESNDPLVPNYLSVREALFFAWSLPISVLITGAENTILLEEKIKLTHEFTALSESQRLELMDKVHVKAGGDIEYYKQI